ncbi:MAG TPA: hypothetical protein VE986_03150 [Hyphomicrobiales bacterium]|nr:hypothetical protein [Hyphomicrobiales bacterium]
MASLARTASVGVLTALPLCGLVLFLEATRPAKGSASVATKMAGAGRSPEMQSYAHWAQSRYVVRLNGISAEIGRSVVEPAARSFTARDAERAIAKSGYGELSVGFQSEFVTRNRRRIAMRIVAREPIIDQTVPDNRRVTMLTPASTANMVSFVWGPWLYRAVIEDRGVEPDVVVQKVL